jgi:hypothetical protein
MPIFTTQQWGEYLIRLTPRDYLRNIIREILGRRDVIPFFYGPLAFDLGIAIPRSKAKVLADEEIKYEWWLCTSKDSKQVKTGEGMMPLTSSKAFNLKRAKNGEVTHYGFFFDWNISWFKHKKFRKISAVDLGHISVLNQYKIMMQFTDKAGNKSERMIMLEFTLEDRDHYSLHIISLFVGAGIAVLFGIVGAIIGYILGAG